MQYQWKSDKRTIGRYYCNYEESDGYIYGKVFESFEEGWEFELWIHAEGRNEPVLESSGNNMQSKEDAQLACDEKYEQIYRNADVQVIESNRLSRVIDN